jgi:hypothetical protein
MRPFFFLSLSLSIFCVTSIVNVDGGAAKSGSAVRWRTDGSDFDRRFELVVYRGREHDTPSQAQGRLSPARRVAVPCRAVL